MTGFRTYPEHTPSERLAEALPLLDQAVEQSAAAKYMILYPPFVAHLGEAYLLAGCIEDASQQAWQVLERSRDLKQRGHEAYALRLLWRPMLTDPKDEMLLELAVKARCQYIVTYNTRNFRGAEQFGLAVVTPKAFLEAIGVLS